MIYRFTDRLMKLKRNYFQTGNELETKIEQL